MGNGGEVSPTLFQKFGKRSDFGGGNVQVWLSQVDNVD